MPDTDPAPDLAPDLVPDTTLPLEDAPEPKPEDVKTSPEGEPTPNATVPDANDPVEPEEAPEESEESGGEQEDLARASNGILDHLKGAQDKIGKLRVKGLGLEGWLVELETFLAGFVGKVKDKLNNRSAGA